MNTTTSPSPKQRNGLHPPGSTATDTLTPPYDIEAEMRLLGCMLIEKPAIEKAREILDKEAFYRPDHQTLFEIITQLADRGEKADLITVQAELKKRNLHEGIDTLYLVNLYDVVSSATLVEHYARKVRDKAGLHKAWTLSLKSAQRITAGEVSFADIADDMERSVAQLRDAYTDPTEWQPPISFEVHLLPEFPLHALPAVLRDYVQDVASVVQVPVDMPAMLALDVVATAGARMCAVYIGTSHKETCNLFIVIVLPPGSRKSEAVEQMAFPIRAMEVEMAQAAAPALMQAKEDRAVKEKRQGILRDGAAKAKDAIERDALIHELGQIAEEMQDVPAAPRLLIDDATPEQMITLMQEQGGPIAMISDEGGIFGQLAGRYSQSVNLDPILKAHTGTPIRVDRKGRPAENVPHPTLTLGLTVQPDVLTSLSDTPAFRGRGLLGRCLWVLPESLVGTRMYAEDRFISEAARRKYETAIRSLLDLPVPKADEDRYPLRLQGPALGLWRAFHDEIERRQAEGKDLFGIRDWASKLAGAVARIAGNLHLVEHSSEPMPWAASISPETVAAACEIGYYLIPHALAAFGQIQADPRMTLAKRLLRWIEKNDLRKFSGRECHQAHRQSVSQDDLLPGLDLLVERGYLRVRKTAISAGRGRPKSPVYEVNPYVYDQIPTQKPILKNTQNGF